jgi:hypothetical protein
MAITGYIYDSDNGVCLARIVDDRDVFDATMDGRKIATIDAGKVFDLKGGQVGPIRQGQFDGSTPEAFRKLLRKSNNS